ncbi:DUF6545 domain-containing protein [Dactylosporangium darangshiense]|uniref:DUF6545 domain-containing protein n=1 Tax=Dactylosporangium darangshiense TaxID=579108 RepID=UPI003642C228
MSSVPHVVLGDPPGRLTDVLALRSVDLRLYRRIIEIRDAQWSSAWSRTPRRRRRRWTSRRAPCCGKEALWPPPSTTSTPSILATTIHPAVPPPST